LWTPPFGASTTFRGSRLGFGGGSFPGLTQCWPRAGKTDDFMLLEVDFAMMFSPIDGVNRV
jgi:hypothetical protein